MNKQAYMKMMGLTKRALDATVVSMLPPPSKTTEEIINKAKNPSKFDSWGQDNIIDKTLEHLTSGPTGKAVSKNLATPENVTKSFLSGLHMKNYTAGLKNGIQNTKKQFLGYASPAIQAQIRLEGFNEGLKNAQNKFVKSDKNQNWLTYIINKIMLWIGNNKRYGFITKKESYRDPNLIKVAMLLKKYK